MDPCCVLDGFFAGPVLPHLADCSTAVEQLAASATQLQSLSLSRYHIGTTDCVSSATQVGHRNLQYAHTNSSGMSHATCAMQLVSKPVRGFGHCIQIV